VAVGGTYLITINGITRDLNYDCRIEIQVNGVPVSHIGLKNEGGYWHGYSQTVVATLSANQEINIKAVVNTIKLYGGKHIAVSILKVF
jgi:hypothetical protein